MCGMFPIKIICRGGNNLTSQYINNPDYQEDCDIHTLCNYFNYKGFTVLEVNMKTVRYGQEHHSTDPWCYHVEDGLVIILKKGAYSNRTYDLAGTKKHVIMYRGSYFTVLYNDKQQGNLIDSLLE